MSRIKSCCAPHWQTLVSFCMLARGRVSVLLNNERCTVHACKFFDVRPTRKGKATLTMRLIVRFWWLLDVVPLMCRLQCCDFCSSGDLFDGELHRFSLCYRLGMDTSARGQRQFDGTWLGFANLKRVVTSTTSRTRSTVTAATGLNLLVKSQLSGKHG